MRSTSLTFAEFARAVVLFVAMVALFLIGFDYLLRRGGGVGDVVAEAVPWKSPSRLSPAPYLALCLLLMLLPVLYAFLVRVIWRLERGIVGQGNDSEVFFLRPESVEPVIAGRLRSNIEGVERVRRCRVRQGAFSPRVFVHAQVPADSDLPSLQAAIRSEVGRCLRQLIGSENASIDVRFSIHEEQERRRSSPKREPESDSSEEIVSEGGVTP